MRRDSTIGVTDTKACQQYSMGARRQPFFLLSDSAEEEDQYVFTSLRYDPKAKICKMNSECTKETKAVYLFKYHYDRLSAAAGHRGWYDAQKAPAMRKPVDLWQRVQKNVETYMQQTGNKGPFKIKIMLRYHGTVEVKVLPDISTLKQPLLYPTTLELFSHPSPAAKRADVFKVVLDALPTNKCLHTKDKTEWRPMYDYARMGAGIQSYQDAKEVLLFNADGNIMDGSITTPYFFRNGKWVTPENDCGGQIGTTRRWALDNGLCGLSKITADSLRNGEIIWLSNAVKGFFTARYVSSSSRCQAPSFRSTSFSSSSTVAETPISEYSCFGHGGIAPTDSPPKAVLRQLATMEELSPSSTRESPSSGPDLTAAAAMLSSMSPPRQQPQEQQAGKVRFRIPKFNLGSGMEVALSEAANLGSAF